MPEESGSKPRRELDRAIHEENARDARIGARRFRMQPAPRWALAGAPAAAALVIAVAVMISPVSRESADAGGAPQVVHGEGLVEFPYESASDVASYADQVSLVTAISATKNADDVAAAASEAGGGLITRDVPFRIDGTLWQRAGAPTLTGTFVANRGGWVSQSFNDGPKIQSRFALAGAPWFEAGSQYLMPLAFNRDKWGPTMPLAEFPYVDSRVRPADTQDTPLARQLDGASRAEATVVFTTARPDPAAAKYFDLQPSERRKAVGADRGQEPG